MLTVDRRCNHSSCVDNKTMYRMVGYCKNCATDNILILFTGQHETSSADCPVCGCRGTISPQRLATEDEFPEANQ